MANNYLWPNWPVTGPQPRPARLTKKSLSDTLTALDSAKTHLGDVTRDGEDLARRAGLYLAQSSHVVDQHQQVIAAHDEAVDNAEKLQRQTNKEFEVLQGVAERFDSTASASAAVLENPPKDFIVMLYTLVIKLSGNLDIIRNISPEHKAILWNEELAADRDVAGTAATIQNQLQRLIEQGEENHSQRLSPAATDASESAKNAATLQRQLDASTRQCDEAMEAAKSSEARAQELQDQVLTLEDANGLLEARNTQLFKDLQEQHPSLLEEIERLTEIIDNKAQLAYERAIQADREEFAAAIKSRDEQQQLKNQIADLELTIENLESNVANLEGEHRRRDQESISANARAARMQDERNKAGEDLARAEKKVGDLDDRNQTLVGLNNSCAERNKALAQEVESLHEQMAEQRRDKQAVDEVKATFQARIQKINHDAHEVDKERKQLADEKKALLKSEKELKQKLAGCEVSISSLKQQVTSLKTEPANDPGVMEALEGRIRELEGLLSSEERDSRRVSDENLILSHANEGLRQDVLAHMVDITSLREEQVENVARMADAQGRADVLERQLQVANELIRDTTAATEDARSSASANNGLVDELREQVSILRREKEHLSGESRDVREQLDKRNDQIQGLQASHIALTEERNLLSQGTNALTEERNRLGREIRTLTGQVQDLERELEQLNEVGAERDETLADAHAQQALLESRLRLAANAAEEAEASAAQARADHAEVLARLRTAEEIINRPPTPRPSVVHASAQAGADHTDVAVQASAEYVSTGLQASPECHDIGVQTRLVYAESSAQVEDDLPVASADHADVAVQASVECVSTGLQASPECRDIGVQARPAYSESSAQVEDDLPMAADDPRLALGSARERLHGWRDWALGLVSANANPTLDAEGADWRDMIDSIEKGLISPLNVAPAVCEPENTWPMLPPWCISEGGSFPFQSADVSAWRLYALFLSGKAVSAEGFARLHQIYSTRAFTTPEVDGEFLSRYEKAVLGEGETPPLGAAIFTIAMFQYTENILRHSWPNSASMYNEKSRRLEAYIEARAPPLLQEWFKVIKTRDASAIKSFCSSQGLMINQESIGIVSSRTLSWGIIVDFEHPSWRVVQCWRGEFDGVHKFIIQPPPQTSSCPISLAVTEKAQFRWLLGTFVHGSKPWQLIQKE
ncbi:hypothetical protein GGS24DRAFT_440676 [Hypoxylon argillaceum]|nr:hypothetical protein GGS24DRAFT_440676 [Hypoxylon argillaceum]